MERFSTRTTWLPEPHRCAAMSDEAYWNERAKRALGENTVQQAVAKTLAIVGPLNIPISETIAQRALEKLAAAEMPDPDELAALETVIRILRPAPVSREGILEDIPDRQGTNLHPQELKDLWRDFRTGVKDYMSSIGRIEFANGEHVGTGFLVGPDLVATNRHVLGQLTWGTEMLSNGRAQIVMGREGDGDSLKDCLTIEGVEGVHPTLDMALLKIAETERPPLEVDVTEAKRGERVVAIGYPGEDAGGNPFFLSAIFGNEFGVRRASLGELLSGSGDPNVFHDCSVTAGSSGSPIFSLASGKVIGIHRGGRFMFRNEGVCGGRLDEFVRKEGS